MMLEEENWQPVVGWDGWYEVSDLGRVRSLPRASGHRGRVLKHCITPKHYPQVVLCRPGVRPKSYGVHRLVLETFVGPCPDGTEACHNNGVWADCRLVNLRWDTRKSNHADKLKHGTHNGGTRHYRALFTPEQARQIRAMAGSHAAIAKKLGVSTTCVQKIKSGKSYARELGVEA